MPLLKNGCRIAFCLSILLYCGYIIFTRPSLLLTKLLAWDTFFIMAYCFKLLVNTNHPVNVNGDIDKEEYIINECGKLYSSSLINRYIYYGLTFISYETICTLLYVPKIIPLEYGCLVTVIPQVLNYIMTLSLMQKIISIKHNITRILIGKLLSLIIKYGSLIYLNIDLNVDDKELRHLVDNYDKAKQVMIQMLINVGVLCLLSLIKIFFPNSYYYKMATFIYNYNSEEKLDSIIITNKGQINDFKSKIVKLIKDKKWDELISANSLKMLYQLYINRDNVNNEFGKFINSLVTTGFWASMIWSLSGWIKADAPLITMGLSLAVNIIKNTNLCFTKVLSIMIAGLIGYLIDSTVMTCLLCEYSYILVVNKIVMTILAYSAKKFCTFIKKLYFQDTKYICHLFTLGLSFVINRPESTMFYPNLGIIGLTVANKYDLKFMFVQAMPLFFGYLSSYEIIHVLKILGITFVLVPLINNKFAVKIKIGELVKNLKKIQFRKKSTAVNKKVDIVLDEAIFSQSNFHALISRPVSMGANDVLVIENYAEKVDVKNSAIDSTRETVLVEDYESKLIDCLAVEKVIVEKRNASVPIIRNVITVDKKNASVSIVRNDELFIFL
jgi:hypothetical protein